MAPQSSIPVAANVLGLIGTICWCIQLCPQIWKSHRSKCTDGVPSTMMLLWGLSAIPFGSYAICQNFNIPLQVQPQFFGLFCTIAWAQCKAYSSGWTTWKASASCIVLLTIIACLEVTFILVFRSPYAVGSPWAIRFVMFLGIVACIMVIAGYIPIPAELILRRGRIIGISLLFLAVDWSGAFFSLTSLAAQHTFDATFGTLYALVAVIELSMFVSHGIWYLRTRHLHIKAAAAGTTFDSLPEAIAWQSKGTDIRSRDFWLRWHPRQ